MKTMRSYSAKRLMAGIAAVILIGCGGGGGGSGDSGTTTTPGTSPPPPARSNDTLEASLNSLGVNTEETQRTYTVDEDGDGTGKTVPLPDDYSPLGSAFDIFTAELFIVGPRFKDPSPVGSPVALPYGNYVIELSDDDTGEVGLGILNTIQPEPIWEQDTNSPQPGYSATSNQGSQSTRAAAAADIDKDGLDEMVVAYVDPDTPARASDLQIEVIDNPGSADSLTRANTVMAEIGDIRDVCVVASDVDGDGFEDVVVGVSTADGAQLLVIEFDANGNPSLSPFQPDWSYAQKIPGSLLSMEMAAGNIDYDNPLELIVVVNEYQSPGDDPVARSRYWIWDDAMTGFEALQEERLVQVEDPTTFTAVAASVAAGDIDADGVAEIVFGGLADLQASTCQSHTQLFLALEDNASGDNSLASIGERQQRINYIPSGCEVVTDRLKVRHVFINTLDIDGDGAAEVQANLLVFDDWVEGGGPWVVRHELPFDEIYDDQGHQGAVYSTAMASMTVGDVNNDEREDIINYVGWLGRISVWGEDGPNQEWSRITTVATDFYNGQARIFPILAPGNIDKDGLALKYSEGDYEFVFTEPVIMAVMAAAPCEEGIGQNLNRCITTYGITASQTAGVDAAVNLRASGWVGAEAKIFGIGGKSKKKVSVKATFSASRSYKLSKSVFYDTGPIEDKVVFSTIPLDRYTYTVVSHPDPDLIGEKVVVNLPRDPVVVAVEREFYNASVPEGYFQVADNVFVHTPGDIDSYPTEADADALINSGGLARYGPAGELVDIASGAALGEIGDRLVGKGIKGDPVTIGAGTGALRTSITFTETTNYRAGKEIGYDYEFEATGGAVVGVSVGGGVSAGYSWGTSNAVTYGGRLGDIGTGNFSGNLYTTGIFSYIYRYGNTSQQQFEVVNFWVQRQARN